MCEQLLGELFLIDDLSRLGINHRLVQHHGRVRRGRLLSDQTEPSHTVFLTVPMEVLGRVFDECI